MFTLKSKLVEAVVARSSAQTSTELFMLRRGLWQKDVLALKALLDT